MTVYGFVGPSGTGKSYHVTEVAKENNMPLIIDDGLLIRGTTAVAGVSAKREKTKFASVKRALFFSASHREAVKRAIAAEGETRILIVGTSVEMVEKIAEALSLPKPEKIIYITDVSTSEEIETAQRIRKTEGKHVIPVPTFQIRKDFSGYWLDPLQIFRPAALREESEKTLVRPTYSYLGDFTIAHGVLITICSHEVKACPAVSKLWICSAEERGENLIIHLEMNMYYGTKVSEVAAELQKTVAERVNEMTGILVEEVRVLVRSLDFQ